VEPAESVIEFKLTVVVEPITIEVVHIQQIQRPTGLVLRIGQPVEQEDKPKEPQTPKP
jgi:hypothetical protein